MECDIRIKIIKDKIEALERKSKACLSYKKTIERRIESLRKLLKQLEGEETDDI